MLAEAPVVADKSLKRLKAFDPNLGVEWVGNHFCIVDESKIMARYKRDRGGLIAWDDYRIVYDRLFHLEEGRILDGSVIDEMRRMDTYRFGDKKNFKAHLARLVAKEEHSRKSIERDFEEEIKIEVPKLKNFNILVPGRRDECKFDQPS